MLRCQHLSNDFFSLFIKKYVTQTHPMPYRSHKNHLMMILDRVVRAQLLYVVFCLLTGIETLSKYIHRL